MGVLVDRLSPRKAAIIGQVIVLIALSYAWLAGGTWLFSEPQVATRTLIDLDGLGWKPLTAKADGLEIAAAALALAHGLTLPGEGADPQYAKRAEAVEALWSRMGTPGTLDTSKAEPLYAGLVDATPAVTEGAARGWYEDAGFANAGAEV